MGYKAKHVTFAWAIAAGKSQKDSAIAAGYSAHSAYSAGSRLLKTRKIQALITERKETLANVAGIDRNWVIERYRAIADARADEISSHRRCCCRYCWGIGFAYQWTQRQYERELDQALSAVDKDGVPTPLPIPDVAGGFGYNATVEPNPVCPECFGEGVDRVFLADSRKLKGDSKRLYAGVKETKNGIEVKMRDQDNAMNKIAAWLGMDKTVIEGPNGGPVQIDTTVTAKELTDDELVAIASRAHNPSE